MENNDQLMHDHSPLASPINPYVSVKPRAKAPLPAPAKEAFEQYFLNVLQYPKRAKLEEFAKEFNLKVEQVRNWFAARRNKAKYPALTQELVEDVPHLEAAKQAFAYLREELLIRMLKYLENHVLTQKSLPHYAQQIQVPANVVAEFMMWRTSRVVENHMTLQGPLNFSHSATPSRSTPHSPISIHDDNDICKMEVDEAAASLPTPQTSVALSPSPSRTNSLEPDVAQVSFFDTWIGIWAASSESITALPEDIPTSNILKWQIPSDVAIFAFGGPPKPF